MAIDGVAYLVYGFADLLAAGFAAHACGRAARSLGGPHQVKTFVNRGTSHLLSTADLPMWSAGAVGAAIVGADVSRACPLHAREFYAPVARFDKLAVVSSQTPSADDPRGMLPPDLGLVGRDRELAILDDMLERISERGRAAIIRGEPGIGKSAFLSEASRRAASRGIRQLRMTGSISVM